MQHSDCRGCLTPRQVSARERAGAGCHDTVMSEKCFRTLSKLIHTSCGIKMPASKKTMLEGRLRKRLRALGMTSFDAYCGYLVSPGGMASELGSMIDMVTTNKTDFFRESAHFDFLLRRVLPELVLRRGLGRRENLIFWSAGCSSGEEPYTLAMVLSEFEEQVGPFDFTILATDISGVVLEKARRGIYEHERVSPVPMALRRKYLLRSRDKTKNLVRIVPKLRALVRFERLNFMDEDYGIRKSVSVIFCRNVLIYFDKATQESILNRLCRSLMPGGYLFMGHSETLHGLDVPRVHPVEGGTTVYRKL